MPYFDHSSEPNVGRMPSWIRAASRSQFGTAFSTTAHTLRDSALVTVCEEARCPNRQECWDRGTATFMILGDTCTRSCGFCAVITGRPAPPDPDEPRRVAEAAARLRLDYVVVTSVNRDDLADGGAEHFAATLRALHELLPEAGVEILTPDFRRQQEQAIETIRAAVATVSSPLRLVWGHNVETVPRLYGEARKGAKYERTLRLLEAVAALPGIEAKSALMLGLGETDAEVRTVLRDLRSAGVQRLAIGQYLRPSRHYLPVREYVTPERFAAWGEEALGLGFSWVRSAPLVRSSYHAEAAA